MSVPAYGTRQQRYWQHLRCDGVGFNSLDGVNPVKISPLMMDNIFGRGSGVSITTPWFHPTVTGTSPSVYSDAGNNSAADAATMTDASKHWIVNSWAGRKITTATGKTAIVASNTATVLTLTAAGWTGGTPAALEGYVIGPFAAPKHRMDWNSTQRKDGNVDAK
jgi:hypothetical protein